MKRLLNIFIKFPKIVIDFNEKWELENWYVACTKKSSYGLRGGDDVWYRDLPEEAITAAKAATNRDEGIRSLRPIFENFLHKPESKKILEAGLENARKNWQPRAKDFFLALSKMLDIPLKNFEKEYKAHFTFTRRPPSIRTNLCLASLAISPVLLPMKSCTSNF